MKNLLLIVLCCISTNYAISQTWTPIVSPPTLHTNIPLDTKVGIGLTTPETMLEINSTFKDEDFLSLSYDAQTGVKWNYLNLGSNYLTFNARQRNGNWEIDDGSYSANAFQVQHAWGGLDFNYYQHPSNNQGAATQTWKGFTSNWKTAMRIHWNGNIKIGEKTITSGPLQGKKVTIDGELVTKGVFVTANNWADYVFKENYKLAPLNEVEAFITKNKHLPNIPSESEIKETGIDLKKITTLQMEKIEELTLYIIQLNKELKIVKNEVKQLKINDNEN